MTAHILTTSSDNPELFSSSIQANNQANSGGKPDNSDLNLNTDHSPMNQDSNFDSDCIDSDFKTEDSNHGEELDEELELEQVATEDSNDGFNSNVFHNSKF